MRSFSVVDQSQVGAARREAAAVCRALGFSDEDAGRVAIIVTELGTNLFKHAGGGELMIGQSLSSIVPCVDILALDRGAGMDVDASSVDGVSTAGTQGTGLGAIRRQSTSFDAYSAPERGSAIHVRVCVGRGTYKARDAVSWDAVVRPLAGEEMCGDVVCVRQDAGHFLALVADGLGHGAMAADAANRACDIFHEASSAEPDVLVESIHAALRATRGAAIAVTSVDRDAKVTTFCGIGNIAGSLSQPGQSRKMTSMNGTAGLVARRVQAFQYPFGADSLLVMHSDGLSASWNLDRYPGLAASSPMLIAAVLYRDFGKDRDDASILVARMDA